MQAMMPPPKREFYRFYDSESKTKLSGDDAIPQCLLQISQPFEWKEYSNYLGREVKTLLVSDRTTDIELWNPEQPNTFDKRLYYFLHLFGEKEEKVVETDQQDLEDQREKSILETSLLQTASRACNNFDNQWTRYINQTVERSAKMQYINEENIERLLNQSVPLIAFEVYDIICQLVSQGMKRSAFGDFETIKSDIDKEYDVDKRIKLTRKLVNILEAKIPAKIKWNRPSTISPVINAKTKGSADMQEYKQTNGKV